MLAHENAEFEAGYENIDFGSAILHGKVCLL